MEFNIRKKQDDTPSVSQKTERPARSTSTQFNIRKAEDSQRSPARNAGGGRTGKVSSPAPSAKGSSRNAAQARSGKSRGAYDSSLRDRLTQQRTREPATRTNQEQYDWVGQRAVRKKADRKDSGMDGWKLLEGMAVQGATGFAESAASTLDLIERQLLNAQEVFMPTGGERVAQGGPFRALHEGIKKEQEDARAVYQPNVEKGGTAAKVADFLGTTTFEAIPQGAVATISAGAKATQAGVNVLNRAAELTPGLWRSIRTAAKGAMENPAFWSSFLQTVGSDYDESIANGASEGQALTMAVTNGLLNAGIEVGGGLETIDATKTFGVKDLVKSAVEEGNEEVAQGITQRGLQNLIYQNGNPMFSTTDENAVLNPWTAAQEWGGGAFAGGVLSGASAGTNALMRARYNQQLAELGAVYQGDPEALVEEGLSFAPETQAHRTAAQMQEKANAGQALTDADLGAMVAANEQTMQQQRQLERANAPAQEREADTQSADTARAQADYDAALRAAREAEQERAMNRKRVRRAADSFGENGAKALRAAYDGNIRSDEYYAGFAAFYQAGISGIDMDKVQSRYAAQLNQAQRFAAYSAGQNDAAASLALEREGVKSATVYGDEAGFVQSEHSASLPKETVRFYDSLARAAGVKIQMAEATGKGGANGWYSNGIIHIANDAENPGTVVAKHEITHRMQEMAPEAYRKYRDYAMSALTELDGSTASIVEQYKSRYAEAGVNLSTEQAMDEIAADFTEALTVDPARFETLAKENRSVARKLLDAVRDFIRKVKSLFKGNKTAQNQAAANAYGVSIDTLEEAARLWEEALKATSEQTANKNAAQTDGGTKFSIKRTSQMTLAQQLKMFYDGKMASSDAFYFGVTPAVLEKSGFDALPLAMTIGDFRKSTQKKHNIPRRVLKNLMGNLASPLFSFGRGDRAGIVLNDIDGDGYTLLAALERGTDMDRKPVNVINSLYGLEHPAEWIKNQIDSGNEFVLYDEKRANAFLQTYGYMASVGDGIRSTGESVTQNGAEVKTKFSLKTPVEETDKLLALHNKDENSILAAIKLGGLPMPSIAIVKARDGHTKYGPISLVFSKDTIDPQLFRANKVYGGNTWGASAKTLQSVATPEYRSIQEIKADSGRLGMDEGAEYEAKLQAIDDQIGSIITKIKQGNKAHSDNSFVESDIIGSILMETSKGKRTVDAIMRAFSKEGYKISSQTAQDIQAVYQAAAEMPTGYFEAKPQRAVGFDEVLAAVIPDDSSKKLRDGLEQAGVRMLEYKTGDDADRLAKINSVEGARFSLKSTDNKGRKLTAEQQGYFRDSVIRDDQGHLMVMYHGTRNGGFTVFDGGKDYFYFTNNRKYAYTFEGRKANGQLYPSTKADMEAGLISPQRYEVYLNVTNPFIAEQDVVEDALYWDRSLAQQLRDRGYDALMMEDMSQVIVLSPEQIKNVTNKTPTSDPDIRYSLKEYTDEEKKQHVKDAAAYFGRTYKWAETGYITTDGKRLDFSGRHEGGPGGYRTVDHRDIRDALGDDYGGDDYSGSMVQFMGEGNIRISPESGGINLSVMPTKAQLDTLSDFISKQRGEVILDLDTPGGDTVSSTEYPRGTHANRVLADIKAYFEEGKQPYISEVSRFRYSLKGRDILQENAALQEENRLLREQVKDYIALQKRNGQLQESRDYWKGQTRRTQRVTTDKKAVTAAAKQLIQNYSADIPVDDIRGDLQSLYDYLASGYDGKDELTYTEARRRAEDIARTLVENAVTVDSDMYDAYSDLRDYLRTTKIIYGKEYHGDIADYGDFRKQQFGRLNLGSEGKTNIDHVYQELSSRWPEFFSEQEQTHPTDQLLHIVEVLDGISEINEYNPFSRYMDQAVTGAANEIMETFFDLPQTRKTFADRQALKLENAKAKGREQVQKVREQYTTRLAEQKARSEERLDRAILGERMAGGRELAKQKRLDAERMQRAREQYSARLAELRAQNRQRVQNAIAKERETRARQLGALKDRYAAKDAAGRERRSAAELRRKITRHASTLSQKLLRPSDQQHIPEGMRSAVAAMLSSINQESQYTLDENGKRVKNGSGAPTKRTEAFRALKEQYANIVAEGGDMVIDPSLLGSDADGIKGGFDAVIAMKDTKLADMSVAQLQTVWQVVKAVEHSVNTAGKVLSKAKYARTADWAQAISIGTSSRRAKNSLTRNHALIDLETPYTFFSHYGEAGKAVYRMLRDAQDQQQLMVDHVTEEVRKIVDPKTVKKLEETTRTFTTERGEKLTLSTAQIMELYELVKRKQAHDHLLKGGVVQPEIKSAKIRRGTDSIRLTEGDLSSITGTLTEEQVKIADGLQGLTTGVLADYGNKASMEAYGYKKFTESDYWPIKSAKEGLHSNIEKGGNNTRSIKNIGMAKTTMPHASNALDLAGIFTTFANHASDMTDYASWLCTMEDINRLFNYQFRDEEGNPTGKTIKGLLDRVGGPGSQKYWHNLMEDIQNGINAPGDSPMWDIAGKTIGGFKGAAVGANIRVVIQQPTAFFRAAAVLDPQDMARGIARGVTRGSGWKKALQYSPIAMRKDAGGFDISSPYKMTETLFDNRTNVRKLNDALSAPAGAADAVTWGKLWNACEWATAREHQGLAKGSEAFYRQTAKLFAEVIDQTQVVDGVLQRSNIMRSSNAVVKQATSFMGEPIMSLNLLMRAYDQVRYEQNSQKRGKAIKTMGRAATALVVTNVVNALAQSLIDAMRDDDEDKKYWERFRAAFTGISGDEETPWEKAWNAIMEGNVGSNMNPLGQIPFVKDALSIMQGYDVSRTEMEIVTDLIQAGQTAIQSADGQGKRTRAYALKGLLAAGAKMFGIPASNLARDMWGLARSAAVETGNIPLQYEMEKAIYNITNIGNKNRYYAILYRALEQGDMDSYAHIRADLMDRMGLDGQKIDSGLASRYKEHLKQDKNYSMPQQRMDLIGAREREETEKEETFGEDDLTAGQHEAFARQRSETYRDILDGAQQSAAYGSLDGEGRNALESAAWSYAEQTALENNSGGQYTVDTKWMLNAREAREKYRIPESTFLALRAQASGIRSLTDKDGESIQDTKGLQIILAVYDVPGLTDKQRQALYAYLGVGKSIRNMNKAAARAKLERLRKKSGN